MVSTRQDSPFCVSKATLSAILLLRKISGDIFHFTSVLSVVILLHKLNKHDRSALEGVVRFDRPHTNNFHLCQTACLQLGGVLWEASKPRRNDLISECSTMQTGQSCKKWSFNHLISVNLGTCQLSHFRRGPTLLPHTTLSLLICI